MRHCFAVMGSGGWFENLGAETEVRESCSEVKQRNSCRLIWYVDHRLERGGSCLEAKWWTEYAVMFKQFSGSVHGLVTGQRKEDCEVKWRNPTPRPYIGVSWTSSLLYPGSCGRR